MIHSFMQSILAVLSFTILCCRPAEQPALKANIIYQNHNVPAERILDSNMIISELRFLSSDTCEGRKNGSIGHELAAERIINNLKKNRALNFKNGFEQHFTTNSFNSLSEGKNIIGYVKGEKFADSFIVVSAHYDHLGKNAASAIYYGADDNASGVACLEALVKYFVKHPQQYTIVFAFFDKEEVGLLGAKYFVNNLPEGLTKTNIKLNVNLDMIARSDQNNLYVCGLRHYPTFSKAVYNLLNKTTVNLLVGHDSGSFHDDWTTQSDHYAFHKKNIPFLYIGVEDHADYHHITDTFDKVNLNSYIENCNLIAGLLKEICGGNNKM